MSVLPAASAWCQIPSFVRLAARINGYWGPIAADKAAADKAAAQSAGQKNAARAAESYPSFAPFSRSGLIQQLEFEGYTREQAEYGVSQTGL